jgi:hypothetical protein
VRRQIAMLLVVAVEARNAGAETQRWKARSTKMPGGNGGMQREARARVSDGNRDATGKAERRMWFVGIARKMGVCNGRLAAVVVGGVVGGVLRGLRALGQDRAEGRRRDSESGPGP